MNFNYTITSIDNGVAEITFDNGTSIHVALEDDWSEERLDDFVYRIAPPDVRGGSAPSFLSQGQSRIASEMPLPVPTEIIDSRPDWLIAREQAYGNFSEQIEFITENGLEAWQAKVAQIKADNPKT